MTPPGCTLPPVFPKAFTKLSTIVIIPVEKSCFCLISCTEIPGLSQIGLRKDFCGMSVFFSAPR